MNKTWPWLSGLQSRSPLCQAEERCLQGERQGFVRISGSEKTRNQLSKRDADGQIPMAGIKANVKLLEGEAEKLFYQRVSSLMKFHGI